MYVHGLRTEDIITFLTFPPNRIECEEAQEDQDEDPDDLPVQGPLPQEPEDAPWKKNDSGVRRL